MPDLSDQIEADAAAPKKAQGDMGSVEKHPLPDLIAADKYLKAQEAAANSNVLGFRVKRIAANGA